MATVRVLADIGMRPIEAIHLGRDGLDLMAGGWIPMSVIANNTVVSVKDLAVYASASTFTVPVDITSLLQKGDKLQWTQPTLGVKYGHIVSATYAAPNTTVTIAVNTDYTIANEAITNFYVSRESRPLGFPAVFNYSPSLGGFSSAPTQQSYHYACNEGIAQIWGYNNNNGTSNGTTFTVTTPISSKTQGSPTVNWGGLFWDAANNGATLATPGRCYIGSNSTTINLDTTIAGAAWTAANGKRASFYLAYPI